MKQLIAATILATIATAANAVDFEVSMGKTVTSINQAYSIGITGKATDSLRWRAGYANLGAPKINLLASADASEDDIGAGKGTAPYYWIQPKDTKELYATIAKEWYSGAWTYSLGGGLALYRPMQQEDRHIGDNSMPNCDGGRRNFTPVIEAGVGYGNATLAMSYQTITEYGDWEDNAPKSRTITTWLRYKF